MEFILILGAVVVAVWFAVLFRYRQWIRLNPVLVGGVSTIFVGTVFGHTFFNMSLGPLPITLDRLLLGLVALVFLWQFFNRRDEFKGFDRTDAVVLGFLGMLGVSTFTHDWSFRENMPLAQLLFFNFLPICLYFMLKNTHLSKRDLYFLFGSFALFSVYLSLTAFAETREWSWAVFPRYIMDPTVMEFLGRGRGPLHNPVANGLLIIIGCCSAALLLPHLKQSKRLWFVAIAAMLIGMLGTYSTLTRIIWFSLGISLFLIFWAPMNRRMKWVFAGAGGIVTVLMISILMSGALNSFKRDKHVSTHDMSKSAGLRVVFFVIAKDMFADEPIWGHGFGQYRQAKMSYLNDITEGNVETALGKSYIQHNIVLSFLTETGLIGVLFLLVLLGTFAFVGGTLWLDSSSPLIDRQAGILLFVFVGVFTITGMVQDVTVIPISNNLLFLWAGIGSNLYRRRHLNLPGVLPYPVQNSHSRAA
jgi:hypothetical protein